MKCVIIAAGMGSRLFGESCPKPLVKLHGIPLIERVMRTVSAACTAEFVVVLGYQAEQVTAKLDAIAKRNSFTIETVFNPEWRRPNGLSVLTAAPYVRGAFLLMMSDHLFTPGLVQRVLAHPVAAGELMLAVDTQIINNPYVDLDDVTRVRSENGHIWDIGKGLAEYDAFDTGVFLAYPTLFEALRQAASNGDESLSGGVRRLAEAGRARIVDIGDEPWVDVDDPIMLKRAAALFD